MTKFLANNNDRQATKADLLDICRALGVVEVDALTPLNFVRERLRVALRAQCIGGEVFAFAPTGRQVTSTELADYASALGVDVTHRMTTVALRGLIRVQLKVVADKRAAEDAQAAEDAANAAAQEREDNCTCAAPLRLTETECLDLMGALPIAKQAYATMGKKADKADHALSFADQAMKCEQLYEKLREFAVAHGWCVSTEF